MLLHENLIRQYLQEANFHQPLVLHVLQSIDSTNQYLKNVPFSRGLTLCCAETQTHGRGRFQRTWFSPYAENIYCSFRWYFPSDMAALSTLSLIVSLAILKTLHNFKIADGIAIKWPNDLLWHDKKLCGILVESTQSSKAELQLIIGIGLNVNSQQPKQQDQHAPDRPWCSLYDITQQTHDRNALIAQLLIHLDQYITRFRAEGFEYFLPQWQAVDYLHHKQVRVLQGKQIIEGVAQGITAQGELLVLDQDHHTWKLVCGEASLSV